MTAHILVEVICGKCGIAFAVPEPFDRERRQHGLVWFCPNGHSRVYAEPETARLRRENARLVQDQATLAEDANLARQDAALQTARAEKAEKRARTMRQRIQGGACVECNRTFPNLGRHMATEHALHADAVGSAKILRMPWRAKAAGHD